MKIPSLVKIALVLGALFLAWKFLLPKLAPSLAGGA